VQCVVRFPPAWVEISKFERALLNSCGPHDPNTYSVVFDFPVGCKIMVDAATRLLSLAIASRLADSLTSAAPVAQNVADLVARVAVSSTSLDMLIKRDRFLRC